MILASFDNAEEDIQQRLGHRSKNEAETILAAVKKGRTYAAWQQLTSKEIETIQGSRDPP